MYWESARIKSARRRAGLSQAELARCSRISQQHVSLIERGAVRPNFRTLSRLLDALGLDMDFRPSGSDWERRRRRLERFNAWEQGVPALSITRDAALAASGELVSWSRDASEDLQAAALRWREWRSRLPRAAP